jgi:GH15 family glucan-1,4-alpha-glucosidase
MELVFHNGALQRLCRQDRYSATQVDAIADALTANGTLSMKPLATGLYPASSASGGESTGYHRVWVRDNVYVAFAQLQPGRPEAAAAVARARC